MKIVGKEKDGQLIFEDNGERYVDGSTLTDDKNGGSWLDYLTEEERKILNVSNAS